jgi:hypothetical protein
MTERGLPTAFVAPTAREINAMHSKSDVDTDANAQHHTLGTRADQAAPGNHTHDGSTSKTLDRAYWGPWQTLTEAGCVITNVVDYGNGYGPPGIRKSIDGEEIHMRGVMLATTDMAADFVVIQLPVGYRPGINVPLIVPGDVQGAADWCRLNIKSNGEVSRVDNWFSDDVVGLNVRFITSV